MWWVLNNAKSSKTDWNIQKEVEKVANINNNARNIYKVSNPNISLAICKSFR